MSEEKEQTVTAESEELKNNKPAKKNSKAKTTSKSSNEKAKSSEKASNDVKETSKTAKKDKADNNGQKSPKKNQSAKNEKQVKTETEVKAEKKVKTEKKAKTEKKVKAEKKVKTERKPMPVLVHDALVLFAITLIAALALGFVYELTKEPIAQAKAQAKVDAYKAVLPGLKDTRDAVNADLPKFQALIDQDENLVGTTVDEVLTALDPNGDLLGYVMTLSNSKGYGGTITITLGVTDPEGPGEGVLTGIEFLSISETAGLGMKAKEAAFKDQFVNATVSQYSLSKRNIPGDVEIDAISSATITTTAVTRMVNAGLKIGSFLNALSSH